MNKLWRNIAIGIVAVLVLGALWVVSARNGFVTAQESIKGAWAQVENQLQRRYDLIPNLVNTVKGYAKHEKEVFENIAAARAKLAGARTVGERVQASSQMESALARLLVVVENYPLLKADQSFNRLMDELAGTENRISVERRRFNDMVQAYNKSVQLFPRNLVAKQFGFAKMDYFEMNEKAKETPKVEF